MDCGREGLVRELVDGNEDENGTLREPSVALRCFPNIASSRGDVLSGECRVRDPRCVVRESSSYVRLNVERPEAECRIAMG